MRCTIIITALILNSYGFLCAQQVIKFDRYKGVLLADSTSLGFTIDSAASRFFPSKSDAFIAEEILSKNKQVFIKTWGKSFNKEIKKSYRQFVGYCDFKGNKHLIVLLLNMKKPKSRYYFKDWLVKPIVGFGEFYDRNLKILDVNLSQRNAKIY